MEMYLETVYVLESNHGHAHGVDIADKLGVSKPSVTKAMNYLKEEGLVLKETYGAITLTDAGREMSERIYQKHQTIETFLNHSLGLSSAQASKDACKIEHVLSDKMMDAIEAYLIKHNLEVKTIKEDS